MQTKVKSQSFVLFWLGLLTGALLILAMNGGSDSADVSGRVRGVNQYSAPVYRMDGPGILTPVDYQNALLKSTPKIGASTMDGPGI